MNELLLTGFLILINNNLRWYCVGVEFYLPAPFAPNAVVLVAAQNLFLRLKFYVSLLKFSDASRIHDTHINSMRKILFENCETTATATAWISAHTMCLCIGITAVIAAAAVAASKCAMKCFNRMMFFFPLTDSHLLIFKKNTIEFELGSDAVATDIQQHSVFY